MTMFGSQWFAARAPASVVFTDSAVNTTSQTTYTFTNHPIGTAAANRKIIVAAECANNARTVSTITVGGVSAALISGTRVSEPSTTQVELWQADVPTGTTGTIVVAWSGVSGTRGSIGVWAVYGAGSVEHAVAIDNSSPYNQDVAVPAGGIIVAACIGISAMSGISGFWPCVKDRKIKCGNMDQRQYTRARLQPAYNLAHRNWRSANDHVWITVVCEP
jgi:hypothetical protein